MYDVENDGDGAAVDAGGGGSDGGVYFVKGAAPGARKQTSAGQGLINIAVPTEAGASWEGRCAGMSHSAK